MRAGAKDSAGRAFCQLGELPFDRLAEAAPAALPRQLAEDAEEEWDDDSDSESDSYEVCVSMVELAAPETAELASRGSKRPRAPDQSRARAAWGAPTVQLRSLWSLFVTLTSPRLRYYRGGRGPSLSRDPDPTLTRILCVPGPYLAHRRRGGGRGV